MPKLCDFPLIPGTNTPAIPFDFHDLVAAVAPHPCLIAAPKGDHNFRWQSVDKVAAAARRIYSLYGQEALLQVEHPECDHDFPVEMRELAYALFEQHIGIGTRAGGAVSKL
jgi:hypothetical protein